MEQVATAGRTDGAELVSLPNLTCVDLDIGLPWFDGSEEPFETVEAFSNPLPLILSPETLKQVKIFGFNTLASLLEDNDGRHEFAETVEHIVIQPPSKALFEFPIDFWPFQDYKALRILDVRGAGPTSFTPFTALYQPPPRLEELLFSRSFDEVQWSLQSYPGLVNLEKAALENTHGQLKRVVMELDFLPSSTDPLFEASIRVFRAQGIEFEVKEGSEVNFELADSERMSQMYDDEVPDDADEILDEFLHLCDDYDYDAY